MSDVEEALAAFRDAGALDGPAKERLWRRISGSVAAANDHAEPRSQVAAVVPIAVRAAAIKIAVAVTAAAGLTLAARWGMRTLAGDVSPPDPQEQVGHGAAEGTSGGEVSAPRPVVDAPVDEPKALPDDVPPSSMSVPTPAGATTAPRVGADDVPPSSTSVPRRGRRGVAQRPADPARSAPGAAQDPPSPSLAKEKSILNRARTAIGENKFDAALEALDEHERRFGNDGQMEEDRDALRVRALCRAGRNEQAGQAAAAFLRTHADSTYAEQVKAFGDAASQKTCATP